MDNNILFPNEVIVEVVHFSVWQDWEVPIPAFFILAPKRSVRSIADFSDDELSEFAFLIREIRRGMRETLGIKDAYLFQNEDTDGNFHLWIFPRHDWMEPFGRKIESVRPIMDYAKENMVREDVFADVRKAVSDMRTWMSK